MFIVRCKKCNKEIKGGPRPQSCGCPNMMVATLDKVTAVDLNQVVMVKSTKGPNVLSSSESFQEVENVS